MSTNEITIDAPAEEVFAVLADARRYIEWIVGAKKLRGVDPDWPAVGSAFHHTVSFGLFHISDSTKILKIEPPHRIVLEARARPAAVARVEIALQPTPTGTHVRFDETVVAEQPRRVREWLDPLVWLRNVVSLRRLKRLVETARVSDS